MVLPLCSRGFKLTVLTVLDLILPKRSGEEQVRSKDYLQTNLVHQDGVDTVMIGYCGLGRAVDALGLGSGGTIELDYVVSHCPGNKPAHGCKQLRSVDVY